MTDARIRPTLVAPTVEAAVTALRERGLRVSHARRELIEALYAARGPVTAETLSRGIDGRRAPIGPTSAYANLEVLEDIGLVRHVHLGHGPARWVLADRERSDFLRCEGCGEARAVAPELLAEVRAAIFEATGYEARFDHFPIVGLCPLCSEGEAQDGAFRTAGAADGAQDDGHGGAAPRARER